MERQAWKVMAREHLADIIGMARSIKRDVARQGLEDTRSDLKCLERRVRIALDAISREA